LGDPVLIWAYHEFPGWLLDDVVMAIDWPVEFGTIGNTRLFGEPSAFRFVNWFAYLVQSNFLHWGKCLSHALRGCEKLKESEK